eukprot:UN27898
MHENFVKEPSGDDIQKFKPPPTWYSEEMVLKEVKSEIIRDIEKRKHDSQQTECNNVDVSMKRNTLKTQYDIKDQTSVESVVDDTPQKEEATPQEDETIPQEEDIIPQEECKSEMSQKDFWSPKLIKTVEHLVKWLQFV